MAISYRWQLIQSIIDRYGLKNYLEIGVQGFQTFDRIKCESKVGVDPHPSKLVGQEFYTMDSDTFFGKNKKIFDMVFIDGFHLYEQTIRDIVNSWNCLSISGWIVIHDCLPKNSEISTRKRRTKERTRGKQRGTERKSIKKKHTHMKTCICWYYRRKKTNRRHYGLIMKSIQVSFINTEMKD